MHLFPSVFRKTNKNARILDVTSVSEHRKKCFDSDKQKYLLCYIGKPLHHSYSCCLDLGLFPGAVPVVTAGHCLSFSLEGIAFVAQVAWIFLHPPCWWGCQNPGICAVLAVQIRCRRPLGCWVCRKHLLSSHSSAQQLRLREFGASGMELSCCLKPGWQTQGIQPWLVPQGAVHRLVALWCVVLSGIKSVCRGWS